MLGRLFCKIGWHKWDMYAGYNEVRVHSQAQCQRFGCDATGKEYLEGKQ